MLKIVPDPPQTTPISLEELLNQACEHLVCALTVAQQRPQRHPTSPEQVLALTALHEIENARLLIELGLSRFHRQR